MTAVDRASSYVQPYTLSSPIRDLLGRLAPKYGFVPAGSPFSVGSWESCRERKSIPEIDTPPSLYSDRRRARRTKIEFTSSESHPLAEPSDATAVCTEPSPTVWSTRAHDTVEDAKKSTRRRQPPASIHKKRNPEPVYVPLPELSVEPVEMTTWQQRHDTLPQSYGPRFPRFSRDYLRIYIAEKNMYEHGKLMAITCLPLLPPRHRDPLTPQCTLGVRHSWNKTYRKKQWTQLNTSIASE